MEGKGPYLAALIVQVMYVGMYLVSKAAFDTGMNTFIFVFYRQASATLILAPLALFFEWKKAPRLSFSVSWKMFVLSLIGITTSMDVGNMALVYTTPSLITAISNSVPVITFLISFLLGVETLKVKTTQGVAKLGGLFITLAGVLVLAFYKGPSIDFLSQHSLFGHHSLAIDHETSHHPTSRMRWIAGCFLMLTANTCWSLWLVFQGKIIKSYPSRLLCTTIQCFFSSVQAFVVAISLERDVSQWALGWNIQLLATVYSGFVVTGINFYLQTWIIEKKGPVFLALSTPLGFIITILCSTLLLGKVISLTSILGGILLSIGLYSVLWGKIKEQARNSTAEKAKEGQELTFDIDKPISNNV